MNITKKSVLNISMLLMLGSATAIADEMENKGIYDVTPAQIQLAESKMTARERGTESEATARVRSEEAVRNRVSEANENATMAREQVRTRELGQQMEQQDRSMSMDRPARMERPVMPTRPSLQGFR